MRCHYTTEGSQRFFIPGCMGGAVNGPHDCCCYPEPEPQLASKEATQRIKDLEAECARLERLVWNLTKHKAFTPNPATRRRKAGLTDLFQ